MADEETCQICGEAEPFALLYFNPNLDDFEAGTELPEEGAQLQLSCEPCAEPLLEKGIAREFPLDNPEAIATDHSDVVHDYLGSDRGWLRSEDAVDPDDNR